MEGSGKWPMTMWSEFTDAELLKMVADRVEQILAERDRYKAAWEAVSDKYEALLVQLGGTDA